MSKYPALDGPTVPVAGGVTHEPEASDAGVDPCELSDAQRPVHDVVERLPGATIQDVARDLSLGHTTATYHLTCLTERGFVRQERDGRALRHFLVGHQNSTHAYVDALLRDERKRSILTFLASGDADGHTVNRIAKALRLPYGFVRRTLDQLKDRDYVDIVRHRGWHQVRTRRPLYEAMGRPVPSQRSEPPPEPQMIIYDPSVAASSAPASLEVGPAGVPDFHR